MGDRLRDPILHERALLHERDTNYTDGIGENFSDLARRHQQNRVKELVDHPTSVLLEKVPQVHLILIVVVGGSGSSRCIILILLLVQCLQASEQFFDEAVENACGFFVFDSDRVLQDLNETLQLTAVKENGLVVPEISRTEAKKVVNKLFLPLTIGACRQDLHRVRAYKVESLLKQDLMGRIGAELRQAKLDRVDERANRVLLVPCQRFSDEGLQVGRKLIL